MALREIEPEILPGKAEFLPDMTEEERDTFIREHEEGWGKYLEPIRKLLK